MFIFFSHALVKPGLYFCVGLTNTLVYIAAILSTSITSCASSNYEHCIENCNPWDYPTVQQRMSCIFSNRHTLGIHELYNRFAMGLTSGIWWSNNKPPDPTFSNIPCFLCLIAVRPTETLISCSLRLYTLGCHRFSWTESQSELEVLY